MRKALSVLFVGIVLATMAACTANVRAKQWGGTMTLNLPAEQKLVVATWKDSHLWYLTRPMREGERAETYTFREDSNFGVMQGTVIFQEHGSK